jgi:hypothetical protein
MYIYMYIYSKCIYIYIHIYIHIYKHIYVYIYVNRNTFIFIYKRNAPCKTYMHHKKILFLEKDHNKIDFLKSLILFYWD